MLLPDGTTCEVDRAPSQLTWTDRVAHTVDNIGPSCDTAIFVEQKR